jgi:hypothetical protein
MSLYANVSPELAGGWLDNWLDAVDGSFCTFEGGDDPDQVCINLHSLLYMLLTRASRTEFTLTLYREVTTVRPGHTMSIVAHTPIIIHRIRILWYHCAAKSSCCLVWSG